MDGAMVRKKNIRKLSALGFVVADSLPLPQEKELRPHSEIAGRLFAIDALLCWVVFTEGQTSSQRIEHYIKSNQLTDYMTEQEQEIVSLPRKTAHSELHDTIGWYLENMWALAWVLGFDSEPDVCTGQLPDRITQALIYEFMPGLEASPQDLLEANTPPPLYAVQELEDLFYCAHNAVRSAQLGAATLPDDFHPVRDGGAIHERRHSLTWCLSPGVSWENTDLSS